MAQPTVRPTEKLNNLFRGDRADYILDLTPITPVESEGTPGEIAPKDTEGPDLADLSKNNEQYLRPLGIRSRKHGVSI